MPQFHLMSMLLSSIHIESQVRVALHIENDWFMIKQNFLQRTQQNKCSIINKLYQINNWIMLTSYFLSIPCLCRFGTTNSIEGISIYFSINNLINHSNRMVKTSWFLSQHSSKRGLIPPLFLISPFGYSPLKNFLHHPPTLL